MMGAFVSAVVLAAGMSKRMGMPKQLVKVGERTLLQIALETIKESKIRETVLVLGHEADAIRATIEPDSTTKIVLNPSYQQGMSSSIQTGLQALSSDSTAALIVLADQPLLTSAVINRLIDEYENSHATIVLPVHKGFRGNPVLIDRTLFPEMMQISGDIGCRSLFGLHPEQIHKVEVNDVGILVDIDTFEDLARMSSVDLSALQVQDRSVETPPDRHLIIIGKEEIAKALSRLAKFLRFSVTLVDPLANKNDLPELDHVFNELDLKALNFPENTYVVIASRGRFDEEALEQALNTPARYVALVGNKKRGGELLERLRSKHISEDMLLKVRCPAGLDIQAQTPEEIALSIMAQIISEEKSVRKEMRR